MKTAAEEFAEVLADELARAGVARACLSPGSRSGPLALAFAADARFDLHVMLDERSACFLALGMAKASGDPVAVLSTSGTAAANLLPAVLEAHHSRTPLVVLTADRPPELRDTGAPQTIDQVRLFGNATRLFVDVEVPEQRTGAARYWRSLAARACVAARGSPPGPVHLNIPLREPLLSPPVADELPAREEHEEGAEAGAAPWTSALRGRGAVDEGHVQELVTRARRARRVAIVAGPGNYDPEPVARLAAVAGWPLLAEPASNARRGEAAITSYEALLRHPGFVGRHRPDLVLRVGSTGLSRAQGGWLDRSVPQLLLDPDAAWLDPGRTAHELVRADAAALCDALAHVLTDDDDRPWLESWLACDREARAAIDEVLDAEDTASEPRTARDLSSSLPSGSTLLVASSMPVRDLDWFMPARTGLQVIANRGVNGIDGFVSTALGVASVRGSATALIGDLATLHDQNGFLNARRGDLNAVFVVLNNEGGGIFSFLPQARREHFEALFSTPQLIDFSRLAELYGMAHQVVERATELVPAVDLAAASPGVAIVEVKTNRRSNVELHERIWAQAHRRLDDALG